MLYDWPSLGGLRIGGHEVANSRNGRARDRSNPYSRDQLVIADGKAAELGRAHAVRISENLDFAQQSHSDGIHNPQFRGICTPLSIGKIREVSPLTVVNEVWEYIPMPTPISRALRKLMEAHNLSMLKLARRAGVGSTYIRDILRGRSRDPRRSKLEQVAAVFGLTVDELINSTTGPNLDIPKSDERGTRADLLQRAHALSDRILRGRELADKAASSYRIAAVIYDVLMEREMSGDPVSDDDHKELKLIEDIARRMLQEIR